MQESGTCPNGGWQGLASFEVAAIRHWFVESDGSYIGPMEVGEVERLWQVAEIDEHTRVWTEGMPDWQAVADVPDLMYLVVERPREETELTPPVWQSTEAASLASLVQSELESVAGGGGVAAAANARPAGLPEISPAAGRDPFARWWTERRPAPDAAPWPVEPWQARAPARAWGGRLAIVLGAVGVVALMALAVLIARRSVPGIELTTGDRTSASAHRGAAKPTLTPAEPSPVPAGTDAVAATDSIPLTALVPVSAPAAAGESEPTRGSAQSAVSTPVATESAQPGAEPDRPAALARAHTDPEPARKPTAPPRHDRTAQAEAGSAAPPTAAAPAKASTSGAQPLSPQEVVAATRDQVKSLAPCVRQAREDGQLEARQYRFILNWRIRADGTVTGAAFKGPAEAAALGPCFESAIRGWRYRASAEDFEVTNFPIPVTVH